MPDMPTTIREIPAIFRAAVMLVIFAYSDVFRAALEIVPVEPIIALITTYEIPHRLGLT